MEQFFKYVLGEIRVIADAPLIFITALLALAGAIWWAMDWRYAGIIVNRDSEIASLKTQRDDYRDNFANLKISGAKGAPVSGALAAKINELESASASTLNLLSVMMLKKLKLPMLSGIKTLSNI
jgi:hypothetical protein